MKKYLPIFLFIVLTIVLVGSLIVMEVKSDEHPTLYLQNQPHRQPKVAGAKGFKAVLKKTVLNFPISVTTVSSDTTSCRVNITNDSEIWVSEFLVKRDDGKVISELGNYSPKSGTTNTYYDGDYIMITTDKDRPKSFDPKKIVATIEIVGIKANAEVQRAMKLGVYPSEGSIPQIAYKVDSSNSSWCIVQITNNTTHQVDARSVREYSPDRGEILHWYIMEPRSSQSFKLEISDCIEVMDDHRSLILRTYGQP